jgi:uncharacterized delta-60 repeat protein
MIGSIGRSRFGWRGILLLACVGATLATLAAPAVSAKKPPPKKSTARNVGGSLDTGFGKGGKATIAFPGEQAGNVGVKYQLPYQFTAGHLEMAPAPGGKIVVAGSTKVARLLANGKPDPGFGAGGAVSVGRPAGQTFVLADAAVDSQGRVLVGGTARPLPSNSIPDPLLSSAVVIRFAADGSLDRSFAKEGVLVTDFGIPAPKIGSERYIGAAVGLRSLVVDYQDRPVVTGGSVSEICSETAASTAFVARLTDSGALDPAFGDSGLRQIADLGSFEQASVTPEGTLLALGVKGYRCTGYGGPNLLLTGLGLEGSLDPAFGFAGFRVIGFSSAPVVRVAPTGRILLLGERQGRKERTQLIMRLLPDGGLDPSFGRTGRVQLRLPRRAELFTLAEDNRGRLLLAGRESKPLPRGSFRSTFFLVRMKPKGSVDRSFGRRGTVGTGFGGPSSTVATQIMLAKGGRILVGGEITSPRLTTGSGFAIARYLSNP